MFKGRRPNTFNVGFKAIALGGCCQPWWASVEIEFSCRCASCSEAFLISTLFRTHSTGPQFERSLFWGCKSNYNKSFLHGVWGAVSLTGRKGNLACAEGVRGLNPGIPLIVLTSTFHMEFQYESCCWGWGIVFASSELNCFVLSLRDGVLCCLLSYVLPRRDDTATRPMGSHWSWWNSEMIIFAADM